MLLFHVWAVLSYWPIINEFADNTIITGNVKVGPI